MASLTRAELETIYHDARHIYQQSRLADVRRKAKAIAVAIERCIGQVDRMPVDCWKE